MRQGHGVKSRGVLLTRVRDGEAASGLEWQLRSIQDARKYVAYSIADNGYGTRAEAAKFAGQLKLSVPATFGPYTFTLTKG